MKTRRNPLRWWNPKMTAAASAAELTKRYGAQALGWARTIAGLAPAASRRHWETVHALIHRKLADPKANPPKKTFRAVFAGPDREAAKLIDARNLTEAKEDARTIAAGLPKGWSLKSVELAFQINPPRPMTYAAARAWERQAAERGVSRVARSARGFMRAYQAAGTFARLSPWWKRRRAGFIARHMAQAGRGERLWERVRGRWRPTRRGLALMMWAMLPPGRPAGARP
jgi:hypothetical protein